jgi:hypothetical protein
MTPRRFRTLISDLSVDCRCATPGVARISRGRSGRATTLANREKTASSKSGGLFADLQTEKFNIRQMAARKASIFNELRHAGILEESGGSCR